MIHAHALNPLVVHTVVSPERASKGPSSPAERIKAHRLAGYANQTLSVPYIHVLTPLHALHSLKHIFHIRASLVWVST